MSSFNVFERSSVIGELQGNKFDLLIIGGGITGAGILLDAQSRGLKAALIEMQDFAAGTSSRSTKLIHGGLRYLKQLELKLVAEVGTERAIVFRNGMHVTRAEKMLLPLYKGGSLGYFSASLGLAVYDYLAGVKASERRKMLTAAEVLEMEPLLKKEELLGGALYYEYRTDDARLTIEILKKATDLGAVALNYIKAEGFTYEDGKVNGATSSDLLTGNSFPIHATHVVNATGPWVDQIDMLNDPAKGNKLFLTKGVHIVLDGKKIPIHHSLYFDTDDKRMVFAIPREGKVYAGTTDTAYEGNLEDPSIGQNDRNYIIQALNKIFPHAGLQLSDIESSWAGLRPLIREKGKSPSAVSRKDEIFEYKSGLISIAGGKLTGYRKMAQRIVDLLLKKTEKTGGPKFEPAKTEKIKVSGGDFKEEADFETYRQTIAAKALALGMSEQESLLVAGRYGSNAAQVLSLYEQIQPAATDQLPKFVQALLQYSMKFENTVNLSDFFIRRTGSLYFQISWVKTWKLPVADYMAAQLNWNFAQKEEHIKALEHAIQEATG